ncbi:unnamed protein product [Cercopithifilaria johnstoni]|uniref:7TM GPCR serpentine receptor class x (Srx) domain-containing protein n=1 Tax=Cercopithifilaria johnstoni TaxID=2874296 RepID=A0A8J2LY75_9BILA|nr:unnamed protein product [Cercopithifilaria johnstoni]
MIPASRNEEIYAAVICFTLSVLGIITNGIAVAVIASEKHLKNAFGYSCMSHAIGSLGVLVIFVTWVPIQFIL